MKAGHRSPLTLRRYAMCGRIGIARVVQRNCGLSSTINGNQTDACDVMGVKRGFLDFVF